MMLNVILEERKESSQEIKFVKPKYDWRYENSITTAKEPVEVDGDYSQWRTNSILSNFKDTILYANEMNLIPNITNKMHYNYLFNSIRKSKRWNKAETKEEKKQRELQEELISLISEYYKYNVYKAKEVLKILTPEQIQKIRKGREKGGVT